MSIKIKKYSLFTLIVILFVAFDQYSKYWIIHSVGKHKTLSLISGILSFEYLENDGVAFSMLAGKTIIINLLVFVMICVLIFSLIVLQNSLSNVEGALKKKLATLQILISFMIAGAIGNMIDRIRLGYVVDFIKTDFIDFPVFNVADCYVTISVFVVFVILVMMKENEFEQIKFKR